MSKQRKTPTGTNETKPNMFGLLFDYKWQVSLIVLLSLLSNGLSLLIPKIVAKGIDVDVAEKFIPKTLIIEFLVVALGVFVFTYAQSVVQNYVSELVAKNFRRDLIQRISRQSYAYVQQVTPSVLLTNLTSDIDAIKNFVGQAFSTMVSSVFLVIGASILLLITDWKLALMVLSIIPVIAITFAVVLGKVRLLFTKSQEVIDWLNKVINESILAAALIRVLNSEKYELLKFKKANRSARDLSLQILNYFVTLIPIISFMASFATLIILLFGGKFVIAGDMTLGGFAAFNSYVMILIFPIIMFGFMSNVIARSAASYARVFKLMSTETKEIFGTIPADLSGKIEFKHVTHSYNGKKVLKDVSFIIEPGTRTAIIGPTAAGKSQLLYVLGGLVKPDDGEVLYSGTNIIEYEKDSFYSQLGLVFQDSSIFNLSLRENIAFSQKTSDEDLKKAIDTAELDEFIKSLPKKLNTIVSERGTSMSGGQKQRVMLSRALAINPRVLLLDDFTARVDNNTEQAILKNVKNNYPNLTLISVTQKIAPIENYDQIIVLMEGELVASGTHSSLLKTSPEYVQLFNSQRSTQNYELRAE